MTQPGKINHARRPVLGHSQFFASTSLPGSGWVDVGGTEHVTPTPNSVQQDRGTTEDGVRAARKPLRRQKSLAEFFGEVLYKSRVQLQELFSRRDRDASQEAGGGGRDGDWKTPDRPQPHCQSTPGSQPDLLAVISGPDRRHMPEYIFPVSRADSGTRERLLTSRSVDALTSEWEGRVDRDQLGAELGDGMRVFLTPGKAIKALPPASLVKSNSDSLCRLALTTPPHTSSLAKAHSDNSCFVHIRSRSPPACHPDHCLREGIGGSWMSAVDSDPTASGVLNYLLVGSVEAVYNEPLLCRLAVDAIIDITNVAPHRVPSNIKTLCPCACITKQHFRSKLNLAVEDIEWEKIDQYFNDINAFITGCRQRGKRVLVASYQGRSRAPAAVVQYLMQHYRIPLQPALAHVQSCRPQMRINPGFKRALERLQLRLEEQDKGHNRQTEPAPQLALFRPKTAWDEC